MLSMMRSCVDDYKMIAPGDKIAVGVSGGKDSLVLLRLLAEMRRFYPNPYELCAITLDLGYGADYSGIAELCKELDVPYTVKQTNIKNVVFDIKKDPNPCALCSKMRRGSLNEAALSLGFNKVALGHHFDDAVETFMLSLFYEGRIYSFRPVTYLDRTGVTQIRPLLYINEKTIGNFAQRLCLPIIKNPCPVDKYTKREDIKRLISELEKQYPKLRQNIFGGLQRSTVPGWSKCEQPDYKQQD